MKYQLTLLTAAGVAAASAQGLYDTSGDSSYSDESAFQVTAGARVGFDDNVNPVYSSELGKTDSSYIGANVRVAYSETQSNANLGLYADLGAITYLSDTNGDSTFPVVNLGANATYKVNERIQLSTNNRFTHGLEPDYERGIANDRRSDAYSTYSSFNAIGIRWSQRFATRHGINFSGADYGSGNNYNSISFRNTLRYRLNDRTILKGGHVFGLNDSSDSHRFFGGFEHSFSERTGIDVEVGANTLDRDNGYSSDGFFASVSVSHLASETLSYRAYARYDTNDLFTSVPLSISAPDANGRRTIARARFQARRNLRLGGSFSYQFSENLGLFGGLSVVNTTYIDDQAGAVDNSSSLIFNVNAGISYKLTENLSGVLNYNHTQSISDDLPLYEYDRNRFSLGLEYAF